MAFSKETCFFALCCQLLLCGGFSKDLAGVHIKEFTSLSVDQAPDFGDYPESYRAIIRDIPDKNFTGFRSAFQWSVGPTLKDGGINNIMIFVIDPMESSFLSGEIGIYSSGSQIGVYLTMLWPRNFPSFSCSNNFSASKNSVMCFNSNYTLISNAIYFLDVEIKNETISGYISDPQDDPTAIGNTSLPRTLIGEIKWSSNLSRIKPQAYSVENNYGLSCGNTTEITTFNYGPESYNNVERITRTYNSMYTVLNYMCDPENTIAITDWTKTIGIYISKPSIPVNSTSTDSASSLHLNALIICSSILFVVLRANAF